MRAAKASILSISAHCGCFFVGFPHLFFSTCFFTAPIVLHWCSLSNVSHCIGFGHRTSAKKTLAYLTFRNCGSIFLLCVSVCISSRMRYQSILVASHHQLCCAGKMCVRFFSFIFPIDFLYYNASELFYRLYNLKSDAFTPKKGCSRIVSLFLSIT